MREIKQLQNYVFVYKDKKYPVDIINFVDKTVAFRMLNENMKLEGVFVDFKDGDLFELPTS